MRKPSLWRTGSTSRSSTPLRRGCLFPPWEETFAASYPVKKSARRNTILPFGFCANNDKLATRSGLAYDIRQLSHNGFLTIFDSENLDQIKIDFSTPTFVYDEATLRANARAVKEFPNAFGLFPRYAMKAAPTAAIIRILNSEGLGIDASSGLRSSGRWSAALEPSPSP